MASETVQTSSLQCKSLISKAFAPHISVTASQDAEDLCKEMGFTDLLDLLAPLGDDISGRVTVRDSQAVSTSFDDFAVRFTASPEKLNNNNNQSPPPTEASLPLSPTSPSSNSTHTNSPSSPSSSAYALFQKPGLEKYIEQVVSNRSKSSSSSKPPRHDAVYVDLFQKLLADFPVSPFETFSHPVAGIVAISSNNHQPIETLSALYNQSHDPSVPEYVNKEYLRYYLLLHDEQSDLSKSNALFEKMKRHFGLQCHMVRIRRPIIHETAIEYPTSKWISYTLAGQEPRPPVTIHPDDLDSLKSTVRELVVQSVIPFMERCVTTWNDQYASSRRGIAGRFFSASRKYFASTNKSSSIFGQAPSFPFSSPLSSSTSAVSSAAAAANGNYNPVTSTYGYLSPEALLRKLADFAFMLRDYKFAYSTYELLKRDFTNDKAWSYLAASQEMCAVSYLLSAEGNSLTVKSRTDVIEFMLDQSTYSYISRCSMPSYALRCILLASELMCTTRSPTAASEGASRWILKALNEKLVGPLGSALLLERVSNSYSCHGIISASNADGQLQSQNQLQNQAPATDNSVGGEPKQLIGSTTTSTRMKNSRDRKAAFWMLLAAREWATTTAAAVTGDPARLAESKDCLELCEVVYGELEWAQRPERLLGKLVSVIEERLLQDERGNEQAKDEAIAGAIS